MRSKFFNVNLKFFVTKYSSEIESAIKKKEENKTT